MDEILNSSMNGQIKQARAQIGAYGKNRFLYELANQFEREEVSGHEFAKLVRISTMGGFSG